MSDSWMAWEGVIGVAEALEAAVMWNLPDRGALESDS